MDPRVRLYLDDPERLEFDAAIVERRPLDAGFVGLVLGRTCFYPTSGGQPHDTGKLDDEPVLEVIEAEDGAVVHRVQRAPTGPRVHGCVDAARRRDHVQQHSGQHVLSATCVALLGRETISFHLGSDRSTIDLPGPALDAETLAAVERRANEIVWEGREVRARLVSAAEAQGLRKSPPPGTEAVRVVEIEGWDLNACCGTHVRRTCEIGWIKILGQERVGGATRLHFVCGTRALAECGTAQSRVEGLVRLLTCHPDELGERYGKLVQESKALRRENEALQAALAHARAAAWIAAAPRVGGLALVVQEIEGGGPAALRETASALVAIGAVALLGMREARAQLLFARPEAVEVDLRPAMQAACAQVEGKGGGPPARVQGSGARPEALGQALAAARAEVEDRLGRAAGAF